MSASAVNEKQRRKALVRKALQGRTRYRATQDIPVTVMTEWAAPYTGGYERVLRAGEVFSVANDRPGGATMVYGDAEDYRRLHGEFVPLSDRLRFWSYRGYYLCLRVKDIERHCERVPDDDA